MKNKPVLIDFSQIDNIPRIIKDYLSADSALGSGIVFSKKNFERQISQKAGTYLPEQRRILSEVLESQNKDLALNELQKKNIESVLSENTFTVVTGHQLNLFTGPAFFIYKILQTVKTAVWLNENFSGRNFVPIFWMATEDHDFEEINHFETAQNFYQLSAKSGGAVGRIIIGDIAFISEFEKEFGDTVYGTELIRWMREAYIPGRTLADATRILVNRMFADFGLLIIDGDDRRLKKQMISTFSEELQENQLLKSTAEKVSELNARYGKVQVNPREINLFYLNGNRDRIDAFGDNFILSGSKRKVSREDFLKEIAEKPENFSPNALMRPLYQETVLPNVAYIGGNAEVAYWLELADYFKHLSLPFPVLVPRNSFLFLNEKILNKIERSGLEIYSFVSGFKKTINDLILHESVLLPELRSAENSVKQSFANLKTKAFQTDKTFLNLVEAEQTRQLKSFDRMAKRLLRAEKIKQAEKIAHLESLFAEIHPRGTWQERIHNFSVFYADHGSEWLANCYENTAVEKSALIISQF